jgi:Polyketide cyclase / dehydrase and lipid transport
MPQSSIDIDATPEAVYALVSDLPSMGRWSPECYRCTWLGGATAAAPGVRFRGYNRIGARRWATTATVVAADPGRELSFDVEYYGMPVSRWTYRIAPREGGCTVTESTEDRRSAVMKFLGTALLIGTPGADRTSRNQDTIEVTLARIKAEAEGAPIPVA